jgi:hypothetical protein
MHRRKMFFASAYIQNKAALRELRDCEAPEMVALVLLALVAGSAVLWLEVPF